MRHIYILKFNDIQYRWIANSLEIFHIKLFVLLITT